MPKRTLEKQSAHDKCVEKLANERKNEGNTVEADLDGWDKPPEINGYIPDIRARTRATTRIIEVETEETLESDKDQHDAFKEYAEKNDNVYFWLYLADDEGDCKFKNTWYKNK